MACLTVQAASGIRSITINLTTIAGTIMARFLMARFLDHMATPPITGRTSLHRSQRGAAAIKNEARDSEKGLLGRTSLPPQGQDETWPYQIVW